ncbi:MAG: efflux RND transporter permease subunit, partial [Calditrichota bacterium]
MSRITTLIKRPVYALLIIFLLISGGLYVLQRFSIDLLPGLNYPLINVVTQYPGVAPEDVELLVTRPIELELQGIRGVRRTSSISAMGISQVTVEFSQGFNLITARQLVSAGLSNLAGTLPPDVHPDLDNLGSRLQQIIEYTFVNPDIPGTQLRQTIKYQLVPALQTLSGISRIEVLGGQREAFTVEPDLQKLQQVHLSVQDLRDALIASNITVSGRYLTENYQDIPIRGYGQVQSPDDVARIYVKSTPDGAPIMLKDVATVKQAALPEHYSIRADQLPAVAIIVQKQPGFSTPDLAHSVSDKIDQMRSLLPASTRIQKVYDQSEIIDESIHGVEIEMLLGALLAILVLHYFLRRWKPT